MVGPTREQIEAARRLVDIVLDAAWSGHAVVITSEEQDALRTLLAATAPPTDEELAEEAAEHANDAHGTIPTNYDTRLATDAMCGPRDGDQWSNTVRDYTAGTRHEGRR